MKTPEYPPQEVAAPGRPTGGPRRSGLFQHRGDLLGGGDVVGEGDTAPAARILDGGVLGERRAAPQREDHATALEEDHAVLGLGRARPAERLVEPPRAIEVGDAEGDEADALIHGIALR